MHGIDHGDYVLDSRRRLKVRNAVEHESPARREDLAPAQNLLPDFSRCPEGQNLLCIHPSTPEDELLPKLRFQLLRLHSSGGALHRIEYVETGLDKGRQKLEDRTAGMFESLPGRVDVNPVVDLFVVWKVQVAESLYRTE